MSTCSTAGQWPTETCFPISKHNNDFSTLTEETTLLNSISTRYFVANLTTYAIQNQCRANRGLRINRDEAHLVIHKCFAVHRHPVLLLTGKCRRPKKNLLVAVPLMLDMSLCCTCVPPATAMRCIVPRNVRSVGVNLLFLEIRLPADSPTPALRIHQPVNAQLHPKNLRLAEVLLLPLQGGCGFSLSRISRERHQTYYCACPRL